MRAAGLEPLEHYPGSVRPWNAGAQNSVGPPPVA